MKTGQTRVFSDQAKLEEMLDLRRQGWSFPQLAKKYNCDHTSIIYWCNKSRVDFVPKKKNERVVIDLGKIKVLNGRKHCVNCDLLISSEFFCEECKVFKEKKLENSFGEMSS